MNEKQDETERAGDSLPHRRWPVRTMFLSWFGLGLLGRAPGTLGSLGVIPLSAGLVILGGPGTLAVFSLALFALGWALCAGQLRDTPALKDPQWIVIDEAAAQALVLAAVPF